MVNADISVGISIKFFNTPEPSISGSKRRVTQDFHIFFMKVFERSCLEGQGDLQGCLCEAETKQDRRNRTGAYRK
jgi:hypothetical protein